MAYEPKIRARDALDAPSASAMPTVAFVRDRIGDANCQLHDLTDRLRRAVDALQERLVGPQPAKDEPADRDKHIAELRERVRRAPIGEGIGCLSAGLGEIEAALSAFEALL